MERRVRPNAGCARKDETGCGAVEANLQPNDLLRKSRAALSRRPKSTYTVYAGQASCHEHSRNSARLQYQIVNRPQGTLDAPNAPTRRRSPRGRRAERGLSLTILYRNKKEGHSARPSEACWPRLRSRARTTGEERRLIGAAYSWQDPQRQPPSFCSSCRFSAQIGYNPVTEMLGCGSLHVC